MNTITIQQDKGFELPYRYVGPAFEMPEENDDDAACPFCGEFGGVHGSVDCHGE